LVGLPLAAWADVAPRAATIFITNLADFPEHVFVVGPRGAKDVKTAEILKPEPGFPLPHGFAYGEMHLVAVPRALAEKAKGEVDLAWFKDDARDVVRVAASHEGAMVYRDVALQYRVDKADGGWKLTLTNPEDLKEARKAPVYPASEPAKSGSKSDLLLWIMVGGVALLLLAAGLWALWRSRQPPTAGAG
jgi:hypothetical protein